MPWWQLLPLKVAPCALGPLDGCLNLIRWHIGVALAQSFAQPLKYRRPLDSNVTTTD